MAVLAVSRAWKAGWVGALLLLQLCRAEYHLSHPRLLLPILPPTQKPFEYNLTASGGCFEWSSRRPDLVAVRAITGEALHCQTHSSSA
jgi:hypothetical protein